MAAADQFAQYGFRRTSMEDIARAAGMSRPALYLHFRNKDDIFRTMVRIYFAETEIALDAALAQEGSVEEVLTAAFNAMAGPMIENLLRSPHGMELLSTSGTIGAEIAQDGDAVLIARLAQWLEQEAEAGRVALSLPAFETAKVIKAALKGVKEPPFDQYAANRDRLATLFAKSLRP